MPNVEEDAAEMDRLWHALFLAEYNYDADPSEPHRERRDDARSQVVRHVLRIRARAARAASTIIPPIEKNAGPIIRYDAPEIGGQLDEFIADNASVHFEAMGDAQFWIGITLPDGRVFHINCGAKSDRAKGYAHCDEDEPTRPIPPEKKDS